MPSCPNCHSEKTVKNGHIHNGKQRYKCHECGRQFVENPEKIVISPEKRELIDRLLLERISRFRNCSCGEGFRKMVARLTKHEKYALVPRRISVTAKKKGKLTIQCDELWSSNCRLKIADFRFTPTIRKELSDWRLPIEVLRFLD